MATTSMTAAEAFLGYHLERHVTTVPKPARESSPAFVARSRSTTRHRKHRPGRSATIPAVAGIVFAWVAVVLLAPRVQVGPGLHELALFAHLAALILGFGAVLTVEWFGLLWLLRRRPLTAVIQTAHGAHLPIWLGLAGLAGSGILLSPESLSTATMVKLAMVLIVALNGLYARQVQRRLTAFGSAIPRSIMARAAGAALISQGGWWTATAIGFLATRG